MFLLIHVQCRLEPSLTSAMHTGRQGASNNSPSIFTNNNNENSKLNSASFSSRSGDSGFGSRSGGGGFGLRSGDGGFGSRSSSNFSKNGCQLDEHLCEVIFSF